MSSEWLRDAQSGHARMAELQRRVQQNQNGQQRHRNSIQPKPSVLRVFQLDAERLEQEAERLLRERVASACSFLGTNSTGSITQGMGREEVSTPTTYSASTTSFFYSWQDEIYLLVSLTMFKLGFWDSNQYFGDRLQNVVYRNENAAPLAGLDHVLKSIASTRPTLSQKLLKLLCSVLIPYFNTKIHKKAAEENWALRPHNTWKRQLWILLQRLTVGYQVLSFFNFLVFLKQGKYRSVEDYFIGLRLVYGKQKMHKVVNLVYLTQSIYYNVIFNFFSYILPLMKLGKVWNFFSRFRATTSGDNAGGAVGEDACPMCAADPMVLPKRAHCGHHFCYYCFASRTMMEGEQGFSCPKCGAHITAQG